MTTRINLSKIVIPLEVLQVLSPAQARRFKILPVALDEDSLSVVMVNAEDDYALTQLEALTHRAIKVLQASRPDTVETAIRRYYPEGISSAEESPLGLFEQLVNRALQLHCSDIHLDPESNEGCVRLRIDGMIRIDRTLTSDRMHELVQAVKVAANLDIAEKRMPQDGQITMNTENEEVSMRVATVPTIHGEKVTLRILATAAVATELAELDALGMNETHFKMIHAALAHSNGLLLLSGPTGSGKTTTLYAGLRHLRQPGFRHILSIEDPVEIPLEGINQVHIDSDRVSFNGALRSALRHDPDVIMIGEIRDAETADIAVKASMTGHLVLSTVHTNDAVGVISRLRNLGVSRDQLTATLRLAVAQRLVRAPCEHCVKHVYATAQQKALWGDLLNQDITYPEPVGCPFCAGTGYAGRLGLYEMVAMNQSLRTMINEKWSDDAIAGEVFSHPRRYTLMQDGLAKAAAGKTTLDEVMRVTYAGGGE